MAAPIARLPGSNLCDCCSKRAGGNAQRFTLVDRSDRHAVILCAKCSQRLLWSADDPLLVGEGSIIFAGGMVRRIWRNLVVLRQTARAIANKSADSAETI